MKRLILLLLAFYAINCNLYDCEFETDTTKCYSHDVDIDNFSCHLFHYDTSNIYKDYDDEDDDGEDDDGEDDDEDYDEYYPDRCRAFPDLAKDQKTIWDLSHGDGKEQMSFMVPLSLENLEIERIPFFYYTQKKKAMEKMKILL